MKRKVFLGLAFSLVAALLASCTVTDKPVIKTKPDVNKSGTFYTATAITFTGDPATDFGTNYLFVTGLGATNANGTTLGSIYIAYDGDKLYIGHLDPILKSNIQAGVTGNPIKTLFVYFNTTESGDGIATLNNATLGAYAGGASFDSFDEIGTACSEGLITSFIKHYRNAPYDGANGTVEDCKLYSMIDSKLAVWRQKGTETMGFSLILTNGVTEMAITLSALYGNATVYPAKLFLAFVIEGNTDAIPTGNTVASLSAWTNIALGTGAEAVLPTPATIALDSTVYDATSADATVNITLTEKGVDQASNITVVVTADTATNSVNVVLTGAGSDQFTGSFTVGDAATGTADLLVTNNGIVTVSYSDVNPVAVNTATASVMIVRPVGVVDGLKDASWTTPDLTIAGATGADGEVVANVYVNFVSGTEVIFGIEGGDPWGDGNGAHMIFLFSTNTAIDGTVVADTWGATGVTIAGTEKPTQIFHIWMNTEGSGGTEGDVGTMAYSPVDFFLEFQIDLATLLGSSVTSGSSIGLIVAGRPADNKPAWSDVTPWNAGFVSSWGDGTCTLTIGTADYGVITLP